MESSRRRPAIAVVLITVLLVGIIGVLIAQRAIHSGADLQSALVCQKRLSWITDTNSTLLAVTALSQQDAWAVGAEKNTAAIMHWDGRRWTAAQMPAISADTSVLNSVGAASAQDIWAVGRANLEPLVMHWDGKAWSQVDTAPESASSSQFSGLAVVSANDVWAVGSALTAPGGKPTAIAQHWDGSVWRSVPAPQGIAFDAITANASGSVWGIVAGPHNTDQVVRWDGRAWQEQPNADSSAPGLLLEAIAVANDGTVWAAGSYRPTGANWEVPAVVRWDGSAWSQVPVSELEARGASFSSIAIATNGTVWIAGSMRNPGRIENMLLERIDGKTAAVSTYPQFYNDPHHNDSVWMTGMAVVPGVKAGWVVGSISRVPDSSLPPIDSNLPVATGQGLILSYC